MGWSASVGAGDGVIGGGVAVGGAVGCGVTLAAGVDEGEVVGPVVRVALPSPVTGWVADGIRRTRRPGPGRPGKGELRFS